MRMLYQFTICVCMVILAGGSIHYIHDKPSFGGGLLLIVLWGCLIAILAILVSETSIFNFGPDKKTKDTDSADRITHLERRLTDIQDIVITIDEKLSRAEKQADTPVENGEKV